GFIVSYRGIEANPEKLKDIFRMNSPTTLKDVQKVTGCMAALSRFVSRLGERAMPFYKLLKKQDKFQWTSEVQQAFDKLKEFLTKPPRSEEHTSELQSRGHLVCRLPLEKKKQRYQNVATPIDRLTEG